MCNCQSKTLEIKTNYQANKKQSILEHVTKCCIADKITGKNNSKIAQNDNRFSPHATLTNKI